MKTLYIQYCDHRKENIMVNCRAQAGIIVTSSDSSPSVIFQLFSSADYFPFAHLGGSSTSLQLYRFNTRYTVRLIYKI